MSYLNGSSTMISDGLNYVEDDTNVGHYQEVFRLIFEFMQQEQHYWVMRNIEDGNENK